MAISVRSEYALRAVFDLALNGAQQPVKVAEISRRQKIPQKFLELILSVLKQGGFVMSRRGTDGGYMLTRPPESITVGEVLRFAEGPLTVRLETEDPDMEVLREMWQKVDEAISGVIDRTNFAFLVRNWKERQTKYVPNWEI